MRKLIVGTLTVLFSTTVFINSASARSTIHPQFSWNVVKEHIAFCESGGRYNARNKRSTASGKYQFLNSTWAGRYGVKKAYLATPEQQEEAASELFNVKGLKPWKSSHRCWEKRMLTI